MTTVYVSQAIRDELFEFAVRLDGDGRIGNVMQLVVPVGGAEHVQPLDRELEETLDWPQLAEDARAALNARLRGWP